MATDVVMPQMGESIAEGTIVRWIKKVGEKVDRDEPLFEISTDKVDAEIPSPAAGVVSEIRVKEGETVPVNSVVAVIGAAGEAKAAPAEPRPLGSSRRSAAERCRRGRPLRRPSNRRSRRRRRTDHPIASVDPVATARPAPVQPSQTAPVRVEEKPAPAAAHAPLSTEDACTSDRRRS